MRIVLILGIVCATALAVWSARASTRRSEPGPRPAYTLTLSIPKTDLQYGEQAECRISLRNNTDRSLTLADPATEGQSKLRFEVRNESGELVSPSAQADKGCCGPFRGPFLNVPEGEALSWSEGLFEDASLDSALRVLPPGTYTVVAVYKNIDGVVLQKATQKRFDDYALARSQPVEVRIGRPDPSRAAAVARFQERVDSNRPITEQIAAWESDPLPADLKYRALVRVASLYARLEQFGSSIDALQRAFGLPSAGDDLAFRLGDMMYDAGRYSDALQTLKSATNPQAGRYIEACAAQVKADLGPK